MFETKDIANRIKEKRMPELNEPIAGYLGNDAQKWVTSLYDQFTWVRKTPECLGIIQKIINDIFTKYHFLPANTKDKRASKKLIDKAFAFAKNNQLKTKLKNYGFDWVWSGDGYLWVSKLDDLKIEKTVASFEKEKGVDFSYLEVKQFIKTFDEDYNRVSTIRVVPAQKTKIKVDKYSIINFVQKTNSGDIDFSPDEIIHAKFLDIDGKAHGYTPMTAAAPIIRTLGLIKDYQGNFFQYGGTFDWMFMFEGTNPNDPNVKMLKQLLKDVRKFKHGNYVGTSTGKFNAIKLNEFNDKMAFQDLAVYYTGVLALAFNMPLSTLQTILGIKIKGSAGSSDVEDAAYWRTIDDAQDYFENLLNTQMWEPYFGVKIVFKRNFRQDDIRVAQLRAQSISVAEFMFKQEFPVTDDFYLDMLDIPYEYRTEGDIKKTFDMGFNNPMGTADGQKSDDETMLGDAERKKRDLKKSEQDKKV